MNNEIDKMGDITEFPTMSHTLDMNHLLEIHRLIITELRKDVLIYEKALNEIQQLPAARQDECCNIALAALDTVDR